MESVAFAILTNLKNSHESPQLLNLSTPRESRVRLSGRYSTLFRTNRFSLMKFSLLPDLELYLFREELEKAFISLIIPMSQFQ